MSCYHVGRAQPRAIRNRHESGCPELAWHPPLAFVECRGCQPCAEWHCRVCGKEHAEQTCPGCVAETREALGEIRDMCRSLRTEAVHRGVASEAMNLLGPVADPEAVGHIRASIRVGRLPQDWLEVADDELHPLTVTWWWNECYREAFEHDDTPAIGPRYDREGTRLPDFGVTNLIDYLLRNLAYAADFADVPFEDFARDVRSCRAHMEGVLRAGEQVETGAPCMRCGVRVERHTDDRGRVVYRCPRCREDVSEAGYTMAVKAEFIEKADMLTTDDMALRTGVPASTIRRWANIRRVDGIDYQPLFRSCARNGQGRKVYRVRDVETIRDGGGDTRGTTCDGSDADTVSNEGAA